ncbi:GNAT family N-acetyltransferase [Rothia terrae]|uniref:GNAT family N-acetyltransferase n=1 Tax=Rothia terrae TaxID=396015 RepID=UPI0033E95218
MDGMITLITKTSPNNKADTITTRPAKLEDAESLARLYFASYDDTGITSQAEALAAIQEVLDGKFGEFLPEASPVIVDENNRIVAAALVLNNRADDVEPADLPSIYELFTAASRRREGLAEHLIRTSLHALNEVGHKQATVRISENNAAALALYLTLDFNRWFPANDDDIF